MNGIREIENLQNKLIKREKDVAVLKEKLERENKELKKQCNIEEKCKNDAEAESKNNKSILKQERIKFYEYLSSIMKDYYLDDVYIIKVGEEFWRKIIKEFYEIGLSIGYSNESITRKADCYLINIYSSLKMYDKAYEVMVIMARINKYWVYLNDKTLEWAKTQCRLGEVENEIKKHLVNYTIDNDRRSDFEGYLEKIKKIRGC